MSGDPERTCPPSGLLEAARGLKEASPHLVLLDVVCVDRGPGAPGPRRFRLTYRFLDMAAHARPSIAVELGTDGTAPSLGGLWDNAPCYEMEVADMFGVLFDRTAPRHFTKGSVRGFPLRKDFVAEPAPRPPARGRAGGGGGAVEWFPRAPEDKGALLFRLDMEDGVVQGSSAVPGYAHKGLEKALESLPFHASVPLLERLNLDCAAANSLIWVRAVEEACGIEPPDRGKALRMAFLELSRIRSHLASVSRAALHFGLSSLAAPFREVAGLLDGLLREAGAEGGFPGVAEIGGTRDVDLGWVARAGGVLDAVGRYAALVEGACTGDGGWMARLGGFGVEPSFAVSWGYTGPFLRACGLSYDLRKASPWYFYGDLDFDVPLGTDGTGYDCYLVRMEEVRQSAKIVHQVIDGLPEGPAMDGEASFRFRSSRRRREGFLRHVRAGVSAPGGGGTYSFGEGPFGETGFTILGGGGGGGDRPWRARMRSPHYPVLFSFDGLFPGRTVREAGDALCSFGLSMGEVDR